MNTESPLDHPQNAVMADYRQTSACKKNPRGYEMLHMFFSPNRIPVGLTDNEVAICIRLYPYRRNMEKVYNEKEDEKLRQSPELQNRPSLPLPTFSDALRLVEADVHDTVNEAEKHLEDVWCMAEHLKMHPVRILSLPTELHPSTIMTRERFRQGIRLFIAQYRKICVT